MTNSTSETTESTATPPPADPVPPPEAQPVAPSEGTDDVATKLAELAKPFANPIPGASRAGENARYGEQSIAIKKEIEKLSRPRGKVNWQFIYDAGREVLVTQSKDFQLAGYFAVASYLQSGIPGLITGVVALSSLFRDYWDDGFPPPKRLRARANAVDWFVERAREFESLAPKNGKADDLPLLSTAARELGQLVRERLPEETETGGVSREEEIENFFRKIELSIAKPPARTASAQPATPQATAESPPASTAAAAPTQKPAQVEKVELTAPTASLADPEQVDKFLREVGESLHKASRALFKASPEDPLAYRLNRQGLYLPVRNAPNVTTGNRTEVVQPGSDLRKNLRDLLTTKNWPTLLSEAESALSHARLWLDLHRYVALALDGLGYDEAKDAVIGETIALVQRVPQLLERAFSDGSTFFASAATRAWLNEASPSPSEPTGASAQSGGEPDAFDQALAAAHKSAVSGKIEEAVAKLGALVESEAASGRERFRARLAMADACAAAGASSVAEGILVGLTEEIERFGLEEWEPKMAEACYRSRYDALAEMAGESTKSRDELVEVYRQLCRVAPAAALKLNKPKG